MIHLHNLSKIYNTAGRDIYALKNIELNVGVGEICGVIGPSGAGKSTLIRCVNLLERPSSGSVRVDEQELQQLSAKALRQARHHIGMIFQHFNLLSTRTVFQNVAFQLSLLGESKPEIQRKVLPLLELTGLSDKADAYPHQLSGGQKQRVAIARALVTQPKVLLCDEMTSALDPETTRSILNLIKTINQELNLSILLITHEMDVIKRIADQVAVIEGGEIVENCDVMRLFRDPQSQIAKQFVLGDLHDHIPTELREQIYTDRRAHSKVIVQLAFIGDTATQPIIEDLIHHSKLRINILQADLEYLRRETIGVMTLTLDGDPKDCAQALVYLRERGLGIEELGYVD